MIRHQSPRHDAGMLDEKGVARHLVARGLVGEGTPLTMTVLSGGVSGDVVAVSGPGIELVVKRPLPRLRVEQEWLADSARVVTEARALEAAAALTPGAVPAVVDLDAESHILTLMRAPSAWRNWRDELLAGRVDEEVARQLGRLLGRWHRAEAPAGFESLLAFTQLRIDPFFRTIAERHRRLAPTIDAVAERLLTTRSSLVHGDFSPKNVLVGDDRMWVLDWEVAHLGDPSFDLAFMLTHLLLKSVHRPAAAPRYGRAAAAFIDGYGQTSADRVVSTLGCLILARVDGKSPAGYLTAPEQDTVRALGVGILSDPPPGPLEVWPRLQ